MKKTVVVTGGAGFIGSFLCEALLKEGNRVIAIDDFSTGHVRNIDPYLRNPDFQFLRLDINEPFDLTRFAELEPFQIEHLGIQEIYHLATPSSIKHFEDFCIPTLLSNSVGTYHVLKLAEQFNAAIVLGSSSVVYGSRPENQSHFSEDYRGLVDHISPRACYDEGKQFAETMFDAYGRYKKVDVKIARIFKVYGPRMPLFDGHQISDYVLAALENKPLQIHGGPEFETSLMYVTDLVDGLIRVLRSKPGSGAYNLGSDQSIQMGSVAEMIKQLTQSQSTLESVDHIEHTMRTGLPDISKAKNDLGWLPLVRLEDGLQKTIDYIKANKILLTSKNPE